MVQRTKAQVEDFIFSLSTTISWQIKWWRANRSCPYFPTWGFIRTHGAHPLIHGPGLVWYRLRYEVWVVTPETVQYGKHEIFLIWLFTKESLLNLFLFRKTDLLNTADKTRVNSESVWTGLCVNKIDVAIRERRTFDNVMFKEL